MHYDFEFTDYAVRQFKKLPLSDQNRIKKKLQFLETCEDPIVFAKPLVNFGLATHRFRVGNLRVICRFEKKNIVILVLKVGYRQSVYK